MTPTLKSRNDSSRKHDAGHEADITQDDKLGDDTMDDGLTDDVMTTDDDISGV